MQTPLKFLLPGRWWRVPLSPPEAVRKSAAALAQEVFGRSDQLATLRAELREQVTTSASQAERAGAADFYFAREIVPGAPVPMVLGVYRPELPPRLSQRAGSTAAADSLAAMLASLDEDAKVTCWTQADMSVARDVRLLRPAQGDEQPPLLRADYWIVGSAQPQTYVMSFSAPMTWPGLGEALLDLTDAVVATVEWANESQVRTEGRRRGAAR
ncbi:MAG: hypothetical protein V9F00_04760 [Nocardioides sp.]